MVSLGPYLVIKIWKRLRSNSFNIENLSELTSCMSWLFDHRIIHWGKGFKRLQATNDHWNAKHKHEIEITRFLLHCNTGYKDIKASPRGCCRSLFYFTSARPRAEQTVIMNMLKETGEPALHRSVSQQPTAQSPSVDLSHLSLKLLQSASLLQELIIPVLPSFLLQILMHLSIPNVQVFSLLLSDFSASFEQVLSEPMQS